MDKKNSWPISDPAAATSPDKGTAPATKSSSEYTKHSRVLLSSTGEGGLDVGAGGCTALLDTPSASAAPTPASPAAPGAPAAATTRVLTFDTFDDSISTAGGRAYKAASSAIKSSSEYTKHSMVLLSSTGEGDLDVGAGDRTALVDSSSATLDELCSALQASSLYSIGTNSIRESND